MSSPISPIHVPSERLPIEAPSLTNRPSPFQSVFEDALLTVGRFQQNANESVEKFLSGEGEDLHRMILATQRAELAFELFLQVRNKVVQAYQEIMRMQM